MKKLGDKIRDLPDMRFGPHVPKPSRYDDIEGLGPSTSGSLGPNSPANPPRSDWKFLAGLD